ncbi:MAG TPA: hypothetical protein VHV77_00650, partial [Pirellulales bacterium]|nr:hypothetical protein [Pirellulales bacterium]
MSEVLVDSVVGALDSVARESVATGKSADRTSRARRVVGWVRWAAHVALGVTALVVGLAVLASLPLVQLLSLGYLLEVSGRIARTGRIRAGLVGVGKAARMGGVAMGVTAVLVPLWALSSFASAARLVEPGGRSDIVLSSLLWIAAALALMHLASAFWRGGRLRSFLWPAPRVTARMLRRLVTFDGAYGEARDATWKFLTSLRLPYYFW